MYVNAPADSATRLAHAPPPQLSPTGGGGSSDDSSECVGGACPTTARPILTVEQAPPYKRVYIHLSARSVCKRASGFGTAACPRNSTPALPHGGGGSSDDNSECVGGACPTITARPALTVGPDPPYKPVFIPLSAQGVCKTAPSPPGEGVKSVGWGLPHHQDTSNTKVGQDPPYKWFFITAQAKQNPPGGGFWRVCCV